MSKKFTLFVSKVKRNVKKCKFVYYPKSNEKNYEAQLYQYLSAKLGYGGVSYQKQKKEGTVDLSIVEGSMHVEIEIKLHRGSTSLDRLVGQVLKYRKEYYRKQHRYLFSLILTKGDPKTIEETSAFKELSKLRNVEVIIRRLHKKK